MKRLKFVIAIVTIIVIGAASYVIMSTRPTTMRAVRAQPLHTHTHIHRRSAPIIPDTVFQCRACTFGKRHKKAKKLNLYI